MMIFFLENILKYEKNINLQNNICTFITGF